MKPLSRLTLLLLAATACGDPSTGAGAPLLEPVVRDSADVRIVENPRPPPGSRLGWRVGMEPAVSIGELEGSDPYLLQWVRDAVILPDGRGLPEGLSRPEEHYRVRDTDGEFLSSLGSFPGTEWFSSWSGTSGWGAEIPFAHRISTFAWGDLVVVAPTRSGQSTTPTDAPWAMWKRRPD